MIICDDTIRWTITVSKKTGISLRTFLAQRGLKKGDISKSIEDAVKWRVLEQTIAEVRSKFADMSPDELQEIIDEATGQVRKEITAEHRGPKKNP